jgi:hypothetical protein
VPYYESTNVWIGRAFLATVIGAYSAVPGARLISATAKIRLSTDPSFAASPDATVAGLAANEAVFNGYPPGGVTATFSVVVNQNTQLQSVLAPAIFIAANPLSVAATITGYWIDDGTNVILMESLQAAPPVFGQPGDFLDLLVSLPLGMNTQILN